MDLERGRVTVAVVCLATLAVVCPPQAVAVDTIVLKDEAYVKGPKVLLGDVADIEGENKPFLEVVEVVSAALPGDCRRVDASLIISRVKNAGIGLDELKVEGARSVKATTLHQEIPSETVVESLRAFIEAEMPWDPLETEVEIVLPQQGLVVPDGDIEFIWRPSPQYRYIGPGTFRGQITVAGQMQKNITASASVEPYGEVVVARSDIPRGKLISSRDLDTEKRRISDLKNGVFLDPEEVTGFVAKTAIFPGQVITSQKVTPRTIIRRNQIVNVETRVAGLMLQSRARSHSDACAGDMVICENLDSKGEFQGIVREDGIIVVP